MEHLLRTLSVEQPVLIAGPTASGKSQLALQIAARGGGVIVNADALQVYDCWRILTARPGRAEEAAAEHRLYGHIGRDQPYSVGHWLREVARVLAQGQRPIIVGGTGLYFGALTGGLAEIPAIPAMVRMAADARRLAGDSAGMLAELDAMTRGRIDAQNPARVQRAWEVQQATGRGLADWQATTAPPLLALAQVQPLVLTADRDWLGSRIDQRFDAMLAAGALDEVRAELPGWNATRPSARAIGAAELVAHLRGDLALPEATRAAKTASRQYAKRQRTWFRSNMADWRPILLP
ncbi:MAG: tRNA (adenosine(37)-N6)-dimethylallyltransferase MiaA [Paracoccaceae bacterium]|nr:tRNA (adenosine(37)-N6)-dimethylallyltransferase MiaA [Paracoccaceae bacterium]